MEEGVGGGDVLGEGVTRTEYAAIDEPRAKVVLRSHLEAALHTAEVWGGEAYAAARTVTEWPDGTYLTRPWRRVEGEDPAQ